MATNQVFVYTMNKGIQNGAWSRYEFPFNIEYFCHLGNLLYMRHGDIVSYVLHGSLNDNGAPFDASIQWPWLDFGMPGVDKMLYGFDIVGYGTPSIEVGYIQTAEGTFTAPYTLPADSFPGQMHQFQLNVPSMSVKLTYAGEQNWQWNAMNLYLEDMRPTS